MLNHRLKLLPLRTAALCSVCLGLPYVAWLAALQRQRVMAKHGVAVTDEEAWATACYPCSLLQMHALLQQQHHCTASYHHQQQASVPLRAPRVQQMTGEGLTQNTVRLHSTSLL